MVGFQGKKVLITLKHSVDNLERSIFDDTTSAEQHLCFNNENMKFWVINTFCFTRIFCLWSGDLRSIHSFTANRDNPLGEVN